MKTTSQIVLALAAVLALAGGVFLAVRSLPQDNPPVRIMLSDEESAPPAEIKVYVTGAVSAPGVYTLHEGARLADAIEAAGGGTDRADLQAVNLALRVKDEDYWHVPQLSDGGEVSEAAPRSAATGGLFPADQAAGGTHSQPAPKLDINSAQVDALRSLPGIGEVKAHAIVSYREQNGDFASVDELLGVPGIGPATLDAVRDLVEAR